MVGLKQTRMETCMCARVQICIEIRRKQRLNIPRSANRENPGTEVRRIFWMYIFSRKGKIPCRCGICTETRRKRVMFLAGQRANTQPSTQRFDSMLLSLRWVKANAMRVRLHYPAHALNMHGNSTENIEYSSAGESAMRRKWRKTLLAGEMLIVPRWGQDQLLAPSTHAKGFDLIKADGFGGSYLARSCIHLHHD